MHARVILHGSSEYPPLLRETPTPPRMLFTEGRMPTTQKTVAIVGTRKAGEESCSRAAEWAHTLADTGYAVISGMALGVDAAAHEGALQSRNMFCTTVAVLATGLDQCYPATHRELHERIRERGCVLTEYPQGTTARPYFFLERNRIIAGLSKAVIVIEAPARSGTLATAHAALEANRDVLVVPGAADDPQFEGSNALIREGATLVRNIADVMEDLGEQAPEHAALPVSENVEEEKIIAVLAAHNALTIDKIVSLTKLRTHIVSRTLTMLTLRHAIKETNGRYGLTR